MRLFAFTYLKPVHTLLAVFVLLVVAILLFSYSKPVSVNKIRSEASEGAGSFHSPLMCI
jgi:hypothetical protein